MQERTVSIRDWLIPFAVFCTGGWVVWHAPAFILDLLPSHSQSLYDQISELYSRKDVLPQLPGLFGGFADPIDWLALVMLPVLFCFGMRNVRHDQMEFEHFRAVDRFALFLGRLTMVLIITMCLVMLYEVFVRYVLEAPTLWANELTLWIAGFMFLFAGIYAMQQRCHIRIYILYDVLPRWLQHTCDIIWVSLYVVFAMFLVYGSFHQVFVNKFYKWEMLGTAFDPPIPATIQPMILIAVVLIALQAIVNIISDWNLEPVKHSASDDIDEEDLAAIRRHATRGEN